MPIGRQWRFLVGYFVSAGSAEDRATLPLCASPIDT
jgi:hypothetical protein